MSIIQALEQASWMKALYHSVPVEQAALYIVLTILFSLTLHATAGYGKKSSLPIINPRKRFEFSNIKRVADFKFNCRQLLQKGRAMYPGEPYRMICPEGEMIVIPTRLVNEIRSEPALEFVGVSTDDSHAHLSGFEPFGIAAITTGVVNRHLNKVIGKLTRPLSQEAGLALADELPNSSSWSTIKPTDYILPIIVRVSSRIFLGEELCRNKDWIQASSEYAPAAFAAAAEIETWPASLHPLVHWFLPRSQRARACLEKARRVFEPLIKERSDAKASAQINGDPNLSFDSSIEWFEKEFKHGYDPTVGQISLSMVAIHTTSELLRETLVQIANHPELFEPLRNEVLETLGIHGLNKTAIHNLKLMDSTIKEAQRLKPLLMATMRRIAVKDVTLPSGLRLRKGQMLLVDNLHMLDSTYYDDPLKFDAYRFLRMRQTPGRENQSQLASTSVEHMGFGHGVHSCPGRFFAASEIKVMLCHLLLKYEWKLPDGYIPRPVDMGYLVVGDPQVTLMIRNRQPEIDIDSL